MVGIPSKSGIKSSTERELVWWLAKGWGMDDAARRAGLPSTASLYRYKRTAAFADDLREALRDRLGTELAPKAIRILDELMSDEKTPARVRVDAAKTLLDRGGFTATEAASGRKREDDNLATYTRAELDTIIADGQRHLAALRAAAEQEAAEPELIEGAAIETDAPLAGAEVAEVDTLFS